MATERQIKANRQNSKRSTGPTTAVGKKKSSRNAFRHGLSRPTLEPLGDAPGSAALLAQLKHCPCPDVIELIQAKMELLRIGTVRYAAYARLLENPGAVAFKDIARIDRYARAVFARQRRLLRSTKVTLD